MRGISGRGTRIVPSPLSVNPRSFGSPCGATIRTGNVAAVMVTGNLPAFGTQGTRMDVTVSALGDSKNLQGGTLLVTPLLGADGNVYAGIWRAGCFAESLRGATAGVTPADCGWE